MLAYFLPLTFVVPMVLVLALFVIFFGLRYLFNVHSEKPISRWWSLPTGLSGGLISCLLDTGLRRYDLIPYIGRSALSSTTSLVCIAWYNCPFN